MTELVLAALIVAVGVLWRQVVALADRVRWLENPVARPVPVAAYVPARPDPMLTPTFPADWARTAPPPPIERPSPPPPVQPEPVADPTPPMPEPAPALDPVAEPAMPSTPTAAPSPTRRRVGFEELFGRKLPIWAGGVTLAVCGVLIVKYSIDAGLLSPLVRVIAGFLFGFGLIAGAEAARVERQRVRDPRVAQALAGAGVATLYAATLIATDLYGLVGPLTGFVGLAGVTALAGLLALRHGSPSAVLGLVGGLAAPALVGTGAPDVPLLAGYLALTIGGLATVGRARRWPWLGALALAGGFGWGMVMLVAGGLNGGLGDGDALALGAYLLAIGVALPVSLFAGAFGPVVRWVGALMAAAELATLLASGGFGDLDWGLFALLSAATVWLSTREAALRDLPVPALALTLLMAVVDPAAHGAHAAALLSGAALIYGAPAAWRVWRRDGRLGDAGQLAMLAAAVWGVPAWHCTAGDAAAWLALGGAALAATSAALGGRIERPAGDLRLTLLAGTAATLAGIAAWIALPAWLREPAVAGIGLVLLALAPAARDRKLDGLGLGATAIAGLLTLALAADADWWRAVGWVGHPADWREAARWAGPALAAALIARRSRTPGAPYAAQIAGMLFGYMAVAQVVPATWLPLVPALTLAGFAGWRRAPFATVTAAALAGAWAVYPLGRWLVGGIAATGGLPLFVGALPSVTDAATCLLAPAAALAVLLWRDPPRLPALRRMTIGATALLGGVAVHIGYKQLFAIGDAARFVHLGLAERTVWEALLAAAAVAAWRRAPRLAQGLGGAALAHLAWFTLLVHYPLWSAQAVGPWPLANLLAPAFALAGALLWGAGRIERPGWAERARQVAVMLLVALAAAAELRQLAHGTLLTAPGVTPAEDIARSILLVALAIGYLLWGIARRRQEWRIGSLLLMLAAAGKVFGWDAAGLDGLARIASFGALGFSLIGIGWLYSRYLPADPAVNPVLAPAV